MSDSSNAYEIWDASLEGDWGKDDHYLNHPGLLYMFYDKVKPMFGAGLDASIIKIRNRQDDENYIFLYGGNIDPLNGNVYLQFKESNTVLLVENIDGLEPVIIDGVEYYDPLLWDASITPGEYMGYLSPSGDLEYYVKTPESHVVAGYIDNSTGAIPVIDSSTGRVYDVAQHLASGKVYVMIDLS
jgi:hypothetical protein